MAQSPPTAFPWECRDNEDHAKAAYEHPLRRANQALEDENLRLKKLLRENSISWSPVSHAHIMQQNPGRRRTRASLHGSPMLPIEVILRILKFALKSPYPIVDPLSSLIPENLSGPEKARGNQIAINFLATCKALYSEGRRYLWESNTFVFTTPESLRFFSELDPHYRHQIKHVNLRIIARYYDDQRRKHKIDRCYHPDLKKDQLLRVHLRPKEPPLVRGGFRCYTWSQIADFLVALRPPYDPSYKGKSKNVRPRLLPSLRSLRMDLVNFSDTLPLSGSELHEVASHELGCTLDELQVTGMPFDDAGMKASAELSGMLKDEGLYLDGSPAFIAYSKHLQPLPGRRWCARVLRALAVDSDRSDDSDENDSDHVGHVNHVHRRLGAMPPAPVEEGHPTSAHDEETIIWKRVPISRDGDERSWMQFSRTSGYEVPDSDWLSDGDGHCPCCGEAHPSSSFLEFMMDQADDEGDEAAH